MPDTQHSQSIIDALEPAALEVMQVLIMVGADINARDRRGRSALYYATDAGAEGIVRWLVLKGAVVGVDDVERASHLQHIGLANMLQSQLTTPPTHSPSPSRATSFSSSSPTYSSSLSSPHPQPAPTPSSSSSSRYPRTDPDHRGDCGGVDVITTAVELHNMLSSNTPPQRPVLIQGGFGDGNTQHENGDGDDTQYANGGGDGRNTHLNDTAAAATKVDDGTAWLRSVVDACGDEAVVAGVIAYPNVYGRRRRIPVVEPSLDRDQSPNDQSTATLLPVPLPLPLDVATTLRGFVHEWCQSPSTSNVADDYAATTAAAIVSVRPSPLVFQTAGTCIQRRAAIPPFLRGVIAPKAGERGEGARGSKAGSRNNTSSVHAPILHSGPVQFSLGGRGSGSQWHHHRAGMKRRHYPRPHPNLDPFSAQCTFIVPR